MSIMFLIDVQVTSIIIMLYIFISFKSNCAGSKGYYQIRNGMVFAMLFEVADLLCTLWENGQLEMPWMMAYYLNAIYVLLGSVAGMMLYAYMGEIIGKAPKLIRRLVHATFFLNVILMTAVIGFADTGFFMQPGTEAAEIGFLYYIWGAALLIPYVLMGINAARYYAKKENFANREHATTIIVLSLFCLCGATLQFILPQSMFAAIAFFLSILFMYSKTVRMTVNNDELTGLYNRRQMLKDADENILMGRNWSLVMVDVNSFKQINDGYGHAEGDRALAAIAGVLREASGRFRGEAYRFGGDEFVMIIENEFAECGKELCESVDKMMEEYNALANNPYQLGVSCGYSVFDPDRFGSIPDIIEAADENMYEVKQRKKRMA